MSAPFVAERVGSSIVRPNSGYSTKLALERVLALILLVSFAPLLAAIALAIKLDSPGPVLFRQMRFGVRNVPFVMFKFRTMRHDRCDPTGRRQTDDADERITRVGWMLRVTSLDELPQLINVVRGDMALIGPRAMPCGMVVEDVPCELAVPAYTMRHRVRPGITGLAQVSGSRGPVRSLEALRERTELDNRYIDEWSLNLDFRILARTIGVVLRGSGG